MEKTTAFGNGSFSNGDPGGGFPTALTICTSPGWITGDLCRLRWWTDQVRRKLIPGNYHVAFEILQFPCLLIDDTSKHVVGLKPSVNICNTN